jgi:transposase
MSGKRRSFTREFKVEAVRMIVEDGMSQAQVSRELGVSAETVSRWRKQLQADPEQAFPGHGKLKPRDEELARLRRENNRLRMENDFLKKVSAYFAKGPK